MRLNDLTPGAGSKKTRTRVGRGIAAGQGKTAGRGHKGQHARSGGYHKIGFEGGQMPLQRRLPRSGFTSRIKSSRAEVRLGSLAKLEGDVVDLATLLGANLIPLGTERVKLILSGEVARAVTIGAGVVPTRGARAAIEKAGGKVETPAAGDSQAATRDAQGEDK
jgi:large subunit ribosomal protein L15